MCAYQPQIVSNKYYETCLEQVCYFILSIIASALHGVDICWSLSIKVLKSSNSGPNEVQKT